jgi:hypothetical protein
MLLQLPEPVIRDTVAAVFSDPAYRRSTLLKRIGQWLLEQLRAFLTWLQPEALPAPVFWTVLTVATIALLAVLARWLYGWWRARRRGTLAGLERLAGAGRPVDGWQLARRHAAGGDYTAAAHALYAGILQLIAGRGELHLHESKTIGDYARELSLRSSHVLSRFREFARTYEVVIYGLGTCDRERFERLLGMADRIAESRG